MIRCAGVSVATTAMSLAVLGTLVVSGLLPAAWANVVATVAGIAPSYVLNRRWVWGRSGDHDLGREVLPFWAMSLTALLLSTLAVSGVAGWADHARLAAGLRTAVVLVTNVAVFGSLWVVEFAILDRVLFRSRRLRDRAVPITGSSTPLRAGSQGPPRQHTGGSATIVACRRRPRSPLRRDPRPGDGLPGSPHARRGPLGSS